MSHKRPEYTPPELVNNDIFLRKVIHCIHFSTYLNNKNNINRKINGFIFIVLNFNFFNLLYSIMTTRRRVNIHQSQFFSIYFSKTKFK
jgi:hypothetical protein